MPWVFGFAGPTWSRGTTVRASGTTPPGWRRRCARLPSFASEVRRQLAAGPGDGYERRPRPELAGLVDAAGEWDEGGVTVRTPSAAVARSIVRLWRSEFGLDSRISPAGPDRFGRTRYAVRTEGNGALQAAEELRFARGSRATGDRSAYLRGAFQGAGSVTRPGSPGGYHLEFVHRYEAFVRRVAAFSRAPLRLT